ncbi:hypothetical protein Hsero_4087 [Herbaspirillum seropedicae SmR1]|uniref:Uncharacterized protein n=1 Tax=Herbaspirillum seropedicae (strain SmR1) TaxID=757424 RepID=D8ITC7_HERSS|nr:hypothetical protein Hsero_4087 [Herbaspirillum seropedicae SmR1]
MTECHIKRCAAPSDKVNRLLPISVSQELPHSNCAPRHKLRRWLVPANGLVADVRTTVSRCQIAAADYSG